MKMKKMIEKMLKSDKFNQFCENFVRFQGM